MKKNSSGCKSPKASMKATKSTNVTVGMDLRPEEGKSSRNAVGGGNASGQLCRQS